MQEKELAVNAARQDYAEGLRAIEKRLAALLTPAQRRVAEEFNPCIIPPHDLKDPVRVGQSRGEHRDIEDQLEMLRHLPEKAWKPVAEAFFELYFSFQENFLGPFEAGKRKSEMERLLRLAQRIRSMSDEDFELGKSELALEAIRPIREHHDRAQELSAYFTRASGGLTKAGKYLLNPRIAPLLEEKIRHVCETPKADLDRIPAAGSCGSCGRPAAARPRREPPGPEPHLGEIAEWLDLSCEEADKVREAVSRAQVELLTLLSSERDDGRNVLSEFLKKLLAKQENEAFALLWLKVPGSEQTYFERLARIKEDAESILERAMGAGKFDKYREAGVDLFKIKTGGLRCAK